MNSQTRILTTHVGSLVRPPALVALLEKKVSGEHVDAQALDDCLAQSVLDVVRQQADAGIDIVSDGEFSKMLSWSGYVHQRLTGIEPHESGAAKINRKTQTKDRRDFAEFYAEYEGGSGTAGLGKHSKRLPLGATGKIGYRPEFVRADIAHFKAALQKAGLKQGFLPVVAPISAVSSLGNAYYKDDKELLFGMAEALAVEYKEIIDAGLMLQIDDAYLATTYDEVVPPWTLQQYREWANVGIEALNHALRGIPADRVRYHVCWGSWNGPHTYDVNARDIIDLVLKVNAAGYSLEMANPRHEHEWRLWEKTKLPADKVLYPGVVTHSTNIVEHPELVCERIVRLAKLVGRENVIASTDCGFAQSPFARRVHPTIQWAKLKTLAEGAKLATKELWG